MVSTPSEQSRRAGRLDVRFTPQVVIWGAAAEDFEEIRDIPERTMQLSLARRFNHNSHLQRAEIRGECLLAHCGNSN
jgi:hypothetical protein